MRKFVIAVVALLVPFTMYAAGCRQDNQAAFPKGPEVKNLARASTTFEETRPTIPVIPPAIDPEVAYSAGQPGFARVQAVMDAEAQLTGNYAVNPGLFVLPRDQAPVMVAAAPARQAPSFDNPPYPVPQKVLPIGIGGEPLPEPTPVRTLAQAPASARPEFWSRPAAPLPAPTTPPPDDIQAMAAPAPIPVPIPVPVQSPPSAAPVPATPDSLFLPEAIPGVYFGTDAIDDPVASGTPLGMRNQAGDSTPPPFLSWSSAKTAPDKRPAEILGQNAAAGGLNRDIAPLPLPPPITPENWTPGKAAAKVGDPDLAKALEPLPILGSTGRTGAAVSVDAGQMPAALSSDLFADVELPEPAGPAVPGLPGESVKNAELTAPNLAEFIIKESENIGQRIPARDIYRMDFWDAKSGAAAKLELADEGAAPAVPNQESVGESLPRREEVASPQKVRLAPRTKSMDAIDAQTPPPPLTF